MIETAVLSPEDRKTRLKMADAAESVLHFCKPAVSAYAAEYLKLSKVDADDYADDFVAPLHEALQAVRDYAEGKITVEVMERKSYMAHARAFHILDRTGDESRKPFDAAMAVHYASKDDRIDLRQLEQWVLRHVSDAKRPTTRLKKARARLNLKHEVNK